MSAAPSPPPNRVCVLTPPGRAAVATVAVDGAEATAAVARFFRSAGGRALTEFPIGRIVYGHWSDRAESRASGVGEGVVVCRTAPQRVEIHCHGGRAATEAIVAALVSAGCREVDWRAWVSATEGDPLAAEARIALAEARTLRTAAILLDQYRGALQAALQAAIQELESGDAAGAARRLDELLRFAPLGTHLTKPWRVVLAGRPNVGKSSLINALVGYRRSIVHDTPGVTRDVVTASTALDGWPVELADTAGVRDTTDSLESAGVARTRQALASADAVVLVFDAMQPWTDDDGQLLSAAPEAIVIHNKCDLAGPIQNDRPAGLRTSAVAGAGLDELKQSLVARLAPAPPPPGAAVPFTPQQVAALRQARTHLDADRLSSAARELGTILGSDK